MWMCFASNLSSSSFESDLEQSYFLAISRRTRRSHLFIFNAGPMLIAVFITEMVILHKYVYLLLLLLSRAIR